MFPSDADGSNSISRPCPINKPSMALIGFLDVWPGWGGVPCAASQTDVQVSLQKPALDWRCVIGVNLSLRSVVVLPAACLSKSIPPGSKQPRCKLDWGSHCIRWQCTSFWHTWSSNLNRGCNSIGLQTFAFSPLTMFFKRKNNGINPHSGYSIALALFIKLFSFHSLHWSFQEPGDDPGTHERCSEILRSCGYYRIGVCPGNAGQNARTHTGH